MPTQIPTLAAMQQRLVHERAFRAGVVRDSKVVVE